MTLGNLEKGPSYRYKSVINKNIKSDLNHPIKHGIIMQAHHVVSETAIKKSKCGPLLLANGYDINNLKNLVYLPSTLEGACHLSVQLHRGDHRHPSSSDSDSEHGDDYHETVTNLLLDMNEDIDLCDKPEAKRRKEVSRRMKKIASDILFEINQFMLPLTSIYEAFEEGDGSHGCRNAKNIPQFDEALDSYPHVKCEKERDHFGTTHRFGENTTIKTIEIEKSKYKLRLGK